MKAKSFQVTKFRNIVDSGVVEIHEAVTCLVGKNEAGKSGMLEALYLLNPAYEEEFSVDEQYPRWLVVQDRKAGNLSAHAPIKVTYSVEPDDIEAISEYLARMPWLAPQFRWNEHTMVAYGGALNLTKKLL